ISIMGEDLQGPRSSNARLAAEISSIDPLEPRAGRRTDTLAGDHDALVVLFTGDLGNRGRLRFTRARRGGRGQKAELEQLSPSLHDGACDGAPLEVPVPQGGFGAFVLLGGLCGGGALGRDPTELLEQRLGFGALRFGEPALLQ